MLASSAGMAQKMSPDTELLLLRHELQKKSGDQRMQTLSCDPNGNQPTDDAVGAYVTISGQWVVDELRAAGCDVRTVLDNIVTVSLPINLLPTVAQMEGVEFVEIGQKVELKNFHTRSTIHVNEVHAGSGDLLRAFTGEGVVVGIVDAGFDFNHLAYRDRKDTSKTRVKRVWNQNSSRAQAPAGFTYGSEYTTAEGIAGLTTDTQSQFHGAHTSITAAGGPVGGNFNFGMAPDADIVLVAADLSDDTHITDAVKYVFDYAESVNKPCVVNLSLGSHVGPHDGESAIDRAFGQLAGPGRIIVGACGNEAGTDMHCTKTFTASDKTLKTMMAYTDGYAKNTLTYFWGTPGTDFDIEIAIVDPTRKGRVVQTTGILPKDKSSYPDLKDGTTTDISFLVSPMVKGENNAPQMSIQTITYSVAPNRKQAFIIHGQDGQTIHMWNAGNGHFFVNGGISTFTKGDDECTVGEIGGTSRDVISVGSFDSDSLMLVDYDNLRALAIGQLLREAFGLDFQTGRRSGFSSRGPTADGRMKPDVMAPGCAIASGYNQYYEGSTIGAYEVIPASTDSDGNKSYYEISMGTSQATPAVTGTIALWLEANPNLTTDDIRGIFSRTCTHDKYTGNEVNNDWGYGKINALEGIRDILGLTAGIDDVIVAEKVTKVWVEDGNVIYCVTPGQATASIYNLSGALAGSFDVSDESRSFDASHLPSGVYIVNVTGQGVSETFKVVVR